MKIQVVGPEVGSYGNVCGPAENDPCNQALLKGGFPFAYIFDNPGVSVRDQLGLFEDDFYLFPFIVDMLIISVGVWFLFSLLGRILYKREPYAQWRNQ
jgi:hypothetical protein